MRYINSRFTYLLTYLLRCQKSTNYVLTAIEHTSTRDKMLKSLKDGEQNKWRLDSSLIFIREAQAHNVSQTPHQVWTFCYQQIQHTQTVNLPSSTSNNFTAQACSHGRPEGSCPQVVFCSPSPPKCNKRHFCSYHFTIGLCIVT